MEVSTDPEGCFLFVKGRLQGQCYTFASINAPNNHTINFLSKTLKMLGRFREVFLVFGGDFNFTFDPGMDTSSGKTPLSFRAQRYIKQCL